MHNCCDFIVSSTIYSTQMSFLRQKRCDIAPIIGQEYQVNIKVPSAEYFVAVCTL